MSNPTPEQRFERRFRAFWSKVKVRGDDECWLWSASFQSRGYGQFAWPEFTRTILAHRIAYELLVGPVPEDLELDHLCGVPACCNPKHLEPVEHSENVRRGRAGWNMSIKTHCPQGHPYDEANTYVYRGRRNCRLCNLERGARWRAAHPEWVEERRVRRAAKRKKP